MRLAQLDRAFGYGPAFFRFQVCVKTCDLSISGMFKINFYTYDGNLEKQSAVFEINV